MTTQQSNSKATAPAPINRHVIRARKAENNKAMRNLMNWLYPIKPVSKTAHKLPRPQRKPSAPTVKKPVSILDKYNVAFSQLTAVCQPYGISPQELEKLTVPQVEVLLQRIQSL